MDRTTIPNKMPLKKQLIILKRAATGLQEDRLHKIGEWMGVPLGKLTIDEPGILIGKMRDRSQLSGSCLAVTADNLHISQDTDPLFVNLIEEYSGAVVVFGCGDPAQHNDVISWLAQGTVSGVVPQAATDIFRLPHNSRSYSRHFAGLSFSTRGCISLTAFELTADAHDVQV